MECKHFLYVCFLFWFFSEFLFLLLHIPVFCPIPEFLYNLSSRISSTHNRSKSAFCPCLFICCFPFLTTAFPFYHLFILFPQAEFQSWLSLQSKLLFVLTLQPGAVSGILCSGGQIWASVSFSISSTPGCYKEIDHRSPVCSIPNAEFSVVMFELWGGYPNNFSSLYIHRFFNGCGKVNSISEKFHLKLW